MKIEKRQLIFLVVIVMFIIGIVGGVFGKDITNGGDEFELEKPDTWAQASPEQIKEIKVKMKSSPGWYDQKIGEMKEEQTRPFFTILMKELKEKYVSIWKELKVAEVEAKVDMVDLFNDDKLKDVRNDLVKAVIKAETERDISVSGLEEVTGLKYEEDANGKNKRLLFKGPDEKEYTILLANIPENIDDINFAKMEVGGKGYAVHYFNGEKASANGAVLSSGYLKEGKDGVWEVWEGTEKIGDVSIGKDVEGAVFFRGTPKEVGEGENKQSFTKGNYVWGKNPGDITFTRADETTIQPSKRDITTAKGKKYCGFENEGGVRGVVKKGGISADIVHQNDRGLKIDNKIIGGNNNFIEITSIENSKDIKVKFPEGVTNVWIENGDGKIIAGEVTVEKGPMKIVGGVIDGVMVDRQGVASAGGRVEQSDGGPTTAVGGIGSEGSGEQSSDWKENKEGSFTRTINGKEYTIKQIANGKYVGYDQEGNPLTNLDGKQIEYDKITSAKLSIDVWYGRSNVRGGSIGVGDTSCVPGEKGCCGPGENCDPPTPEVGKENWRKELLDKLGGGTSWGNKQETKNEIIGGVKQEIIKEKNVQGQRQIMTKNGGFYYCPVCNGGAGGWLPLPQESYF